MEMHLGELLQPRKTNDDNYSRILLAAHDQLTIEQKPLFNKFLRHNESEIRGMIFYCAQPGAKNKKKFTQHQCRGLASFIHRDAGISVRFTKKDDVKAAKVANMGIVKLMRAPPNNVVVALNHVAEIFLEHQKTVSKLVNHYDA